MQASDLLRFDSTRMREIGHQTIDALVDEMTNAQTGPVVRKGTVDDMRRRLQAPPPDAPVPFDQVLAQVFTDITPFRGRPDAAGYLAFIPAASLWPSALADLIGAALNLDSCWWAGGAGVSQLELTVLGWFADWLGYPSDASGVLVSGGSAANLTALACARERRAGAMRDDLVVYISAQSHSSMARAARALGFRPERVRVLPVDRDFRLRLDVLERAIAADRATGLWPLAVCANAGTTNTGAVDPLPELADLCASQEVWLHVDAAYGGFAVLTERGRAALDGIERADSVTLDPHKWLFQPFEVGAVLVREPDALRRAFEILPDYLRDVSAHEEVNFSDRGLQLSRACRSLKVWMSVRTFGLDAFRKAIDHGLDLAAEAAARVEASDELELLAPVPLSVVALRRVPAGMDDERRIDDVNAALVGAVEDAGDVYVSSTRLFGRQAIRLCILNPWTKAEHVHRALDIIESTPVDDLRLPPRPPQERHPDVTAGWLGRPTVSAQDVGAVSLFALMGDALTKRVIAEARERRLTVGETLIEQWDTSRDVYVILEGEFSVSDDERDLGVVGRGDFVGEMAALDWGAGYGPLRAAEVRALTPGKVLVLSPAALREALAGSPSARELVERAARSRLAQLRPTSEPT
ncbi:MAG TPA: aminotransferase class I/II-fold pyridoxal phosphate-dependent enzyme [Thermoleophilia bacterium]|nr:aminotransferase class I/II-fold pyridoxal phosphate-dependent enzyme [Thermoleophilia bacterium]